jgi:hypothetical protein
MALQPQDGKLQFYSNIIFFPVLFLEQNDLQTTHQYINLEPFQFLENIASNPISTFNFSSGKDSLFD